MVKRSLAVLLVALWINGIVMISARSWSGSVDFEVLPGMGKDPMSQILVEIERDAMYFSEEPSTVPSMAPSLSLEPSASPSSVPSDSPTLSPSADPTLAPSLKPSSFPSLLPTPQPSVSNAPTTSPSSTPTISFSPSQSPTLTVSDSPSQSPSALILENNPLPRPIPDNFFNYDTRRLAQWGPKNWGNVEKSPEYWYWLEFQDYLKKDLSDNRCSNPHSSRQSPIDLRPDIVSTECLPYHEIRHQKGEYHVSNVTVTKQILPSKLRLVYPRRPQSNPLSIDPPSADVPKGWGKQLDIIHIDLKFPSEHTINGTQYSGEYQINIIQKEGRGAPVISVLIDVHPDDEVNEHFQMLIDEFQSVHQANEMRCEEDTRRAARLEGPWYRRMQESLTQSDEFSTWADEPDEDERAFRMRQAEISRKTQGKFKPWDPWLEGSIMNSPWFYGYWGSLTEPPCSEFIMWHVIDTPMYLSSGQIQQLRNILFNNRDPSNRCRHTSVHWNGSVARPTQALRGREVWKCTCADFIPDAQRKAECRKRCTQKIGAKCDDDAFLQDDDITF